MPQRDVYGDAAFSPIDPRRVVAVVLLVVFITEGAIMLLFPILPTWTREPLASSVLDATVLSLATAPALWFLVVRPSRGMFLARGRMIEHLFDIQERERTRLAGDLHDEVGQHLTAVIVGLKTVESSSSLPDAVAHAARLREAAARGLDEVRRLVRGLRPGVLVDLGLPAAVERLCEDFETNHGVKVTLALDLAEDRQSEVVLETAIYRMLQETLTNIARHARASAADVTLSWDRRLATLQIADNGCGFVAHNTDEPRSPLQSYGLNSIRERARILGGQVAVRSGAGMGTTVTIKIPFRQPKDG